MAIVLSARTESWLRCFNCGNGIKKSSLAFKFDQATISANPKLLGRNVFCSIECAEKYLADLQPKPTEPVGKCPCGKPIAAGSKWYCEDCESHDRYSFETGRPISVDNYQYFADHEQWLLDQAGKSPEEESKTPWLPRMLNDGTKLSRNGEMIPDANEQGLGPDAYPVYTPKDEELF